MLNFSVLKILQSFLHSFIFTIIKSAVLFKDSWQNGADGGISDTARDHVVSQSMTLKRGSLRVVHSFGLRHLVTGLLE